MRIVKVQTPKKKFKVNKNMGIGLLIVGLFVSVLTFKILYIGDSAANETDGIIKQALLSGIKPTAEERVGNVSRGVGMDRIMFEYDLSKLSCSAHIARIIKDNTNRVAATDFQTEFFEAVYCIVGYESGFNPKCEVNDKREWSIGLLQINVRSNYPKTWDKNKLKDPAFNLQYQLPELYTEYCMARSKGLTGEKLIQEISKRGQRPDWSAKNRAYIINSISKSYAEIKAARIN